VVGEEVLILRPDSTRSRVFSRWKGPAKVIAVKSPYSYVVELDGATYHLHANDLRRYNVKADEVTYGPSALGDQRVCTVQLIPQEDDEICDSLCDALNFAQETKIQTQSLSVATCAIIHEEDEDFGAVQSIAASPLRRGSGGFSPGKFFRFEIAVREF